MRDDPTDRGAADAVDEARAIAMERYELSEGGAVALLGRLARRHRVELQVVALAVIAAAVARRAST